MGTIAYIAGSFPARSETFVYREVRELRRRGWTVHCASLNPPGEPGLAQFQDLEQGLTVVYGSPRWILDALLEQLAHPISAIGTMAQAYFDALFPGEPMGLRARLKLPFQALAGQALARRLRGKGVQHLHCHFAHAPTSVGMYAAQQLGIPFSFTGHANDLFQRRALLRGKLARARFVACISAWHRAFYRTIRDAGDKYAIIRCGVDLATWSPAPPREQISDTLRILTVCRLVDKKGVDTLIRALARLRNSGMPCHLTAGGDGPAAERLRELARQEGCEDAVTWLGAVDNERVPELLRQADVFALPCRTDGSGDRDGIPVVLMEAMACGVPIVSGDLPAIRELVQHEVSGLLVDGNDAEAVATALQQLATDHALRRRLSDGGRQRVETEFALDTNVGRLEQCIRGERTTGTPGPTPSDAVAAVG